MSVQAGWHSGGNAVGDELSARLPAIVALAALVLGLLELAVRVCLLLVSFCFLVGLFVMADNPDFVVPYLWRKALP